MTDWMTTILVVYIIGFLIVVLGALAAMPSNPWYHRHDRKLKARVVLTAPIWPLWIPVGIVYGLCRLIQIARTGE
ncbi:MAG: hypothetical protein ACTH4Y_08250 [Microbacterium gubbeenense]|uniref:hypothetical protein n=1 Tax=Microbacterium gubbeenense TaxID=159896 RepID=UPI003F98F45C